MNKMIGNKKWGSEHPRECLEKKLADLYPEKSFEDEDSFFETLNDYHDHVCTQYDCIREDQKKIAELFISNPRLGAMISDVVNGDDPLMACIRYFGLEALVASEDPDAMRRIREENDEFSQRINRFRETEEKIEKNLKNSEKAIVRFKKAKEMDDEDFSYFIERIQHLCEHVFMNDLNSEVLELFYKGLNYDNDLSCTERISEARGRNSRIVLEKRRYSQKSIPDLQNRQGGGDEEDNRTPGFGHKRRPSVWDL